jgi:pimeloyl-ACP methyl ester carboxylesterase
MIGHSFEFEGSKLYFTKSGNGGKILLAFHGFGQDHDVFSSLSTSFPEHTIISFDIFFHGKSEWSHGEKPLEKEFWNRLIHQFLFQHNIHSFGVLGYSMGGKFALAITERFPEHVKEIFLLAPDGIKTSLWYSLATYPQLLRSLFKSMILKPERFQNIITLARTLHFIDKGILRFAETQMNTEEKRKQVYYAWVVFRHLKFDVRKIAALINSNNINLTMILGKHDKIITSKNMEKLLKGVKKYKLEILETGHTGLISKLSTL